MWREKADVVQGIAGGYSLIWFLLMITGIAYTTGVGYQPEIFEVIFYGIVPLFLSISVISSRENKGISIGGILLFIVSILYIVYYILSPIPVILSISLDTLTIFANLILGIAGIILLLEAFDIIKPVKLS